MFWDSDAPCCGTPRRPRYRAVTLPAPGRDSGDRLDGHTTTQPYWSRGIPSLCVSWMAGSASPEARATLVKTMSNTFRARTLTLCLILGITRVWNGRSDFSGILMSMKMEELSRRATKLGGSGNCFPQILGSIFRRMHCI